MSAENPPSVKADPVDRLMAGFVLVAMFVLLPLCVVAIVVGIVLTPEARIAVAIVGGFVGLCWLLGGLGLRWLDRDR